MKVTKIMSKNIVTVCMDDELARIDKIFREDKFHHVLVVEYQKLVGVISDRDLHMALSPNIGTAAETTKDTATLRKRAHQIMTRKLVVLNACSGIHDAVALFNSYRISCIPVVDDNDKPVGIISWRDIFRVLSVHNKNNLKSSNHS